MADSEMIPGGYSDGNVDTNRSNNPTLESIVEKRYSRRQTLFGGMTATAAALFLSACGEDKDEAPIVDSGGARSTSSGKLVTLKGSATDAKGSITSSAWTQVSGPSVTFLSNSGDTATFIAPSVASSTDFVFHFAAQDNGGNTTTADSTVTVAPGKLDFTAVPKNLNDIVTVPAGYSVTVLYRLGDPITAATPAYANNGTDGNFAQRAGDHHDGMTYFGLAATGNARDDLSSTRGLLAINHENITQRYLHPNGPTGTGTGQSRPEAEAIKEIEAHGMSVIEIARGATGWSYVQGSALNRRITPLTPMVFNGPVRGSTQLRTRFSPDGTQGRGTINNCANGTMPWGSYLTCEENWVGYFRRGGTDNAARGGATAKSVISLNRYGSSQGASGNYGWSTVSPADPTNSGFARWNVSVDPLAPADGTGDFRNEINQYGWVVEVDPYDPTSTPRKRTALGRMNHEGCWPSKMVEGRKPAFYMGDDARGEYLYKFVSNTPWVAADANNTNRLAMGDKYLDAGTLYVARFDATGQGVWLPLVFGQGSLTPSNAAYPFADQADVLINARLAADAVGATKMDRPEWTTVNPKTGEMYLTLTNNNASVRPLNGTDAANPRHYNDPKDTTAQRGNPNGHILRLRETGDSSEATTFQWDIYTFGAGADLDATNINISGLDASNDFSSPDGLWFSRPTNPGGLVNPLMWIQTDDGAYTDVTNCMMLAAMPGVVGDGGVKTITNTGADGSTSSQQTFAGKAPGSNLRRFLVGPKECEITGIDSTPDGRTLFVNIQHPGEDVGTNFPTSFSSNWPASQTSSSAVSRPRSATIIITKDDGGVVGL
ncbi:phosphatase [Sphingomonas oleivorans]|uniref:Phosphatase n=1 Tax=Sphingomonas oleivorans TaxID=1735121 RepID=A0A2T5FVR6_9SPHN|nr:PhoX family phosphatase [Sphingomonas oleivorans]PTQ09869.1 phosphatase [Sphingomonas oleivorans]